MRRKDSWSYRNEANGSQDDRRFNVYGYRFSLEPTKQVQSTTLPDDPVR